MSCDEANLVIEAVAAGDEVPDAAQAHIAGCSRCAARLALARRIDAALAGRPVPAPAASFTSAVLARLRRDRWRSEQVVDVGFNIAVAAGLILIVGGIAGIAYRAGALALSAEMAAFVFGYTRTVASGIVADARLVTIATLLLTTAVGLWWWAEGDAAL
jgi:anti-sigma factor RsiW